MAAGCGGIATLAIALLPPIDAWASQLFWVHMLQHLLLVYLAAPLFAIAAPFVFEHAGAGRRMAWLTRPAAAFGLSTAVLWLWHVPRAYDFALQSDVAHALEHVSFLGAFAIYWWVLVAQVLGGGQLSTNGARSLYILAGSAQAMLLGALIMFSNHVLYSHYLLTTHPSSLSSLADQQLGGALMWFPGPVIYGFAAVLTLRDQ